MESNDNIRRLLEEIRDTQRERFAAYRKAAERSAALQGEAAARQRSHTELYRRRMVAGAVMVLAVLGLVPYLSRSYLQPY